MNKMKKLALLLLAVAAGNSAGAQQPIYTQGCKQYAFTGSTATGSGDITYQWYRDGQPISGAIGKDYILPLKQAYGENVEFKRGVISSGCIGEVAFSDPIYLTFSGVKIDTLCWAHTNVDAPYTFAPKPDMYTSLYQWNRVVAWAATGAVSNWNSTPDLSETWTNNPCPSGWRLPAQGEYHALNSAGTTWADARTRGNEVNGRFYGPNHDNCTLPNNMSGCIFLPATGSRVNTDGHITNPGTKAEYWSSTINNNDVNAYSVLCLSFQSSSSSTSNNFNKAYGFSVRCVQ